jgi:hypothetical protein
MANLDQICDYLADNVLYYKDYNGTVGTTQASGWYYHDQPLNLPDNAVILGIFAAYAGSQRPLIAQTYNSYSTLRVMASYQNTAYVVRVLYKIEA